VAARNKVEVVIAGKEYTIVGTETNEYIQTVASLVDKKMSEIIDSNIKLSTSMAAVLTAVNITDELYKSKEEINVLKEELNRNRDNLAKYKDDFERMKKENIRIADDNTGLINKNSVLKIEFAKKEAELNELKNLLEEMEKEIF
jgi:cell division protein ZapA